MTHIYYEYIKYMNHICSVNGFPVTGEQKQAQKYNDNNDKEHECDCAANYSHSHDGQRHLKEKHHRLNMCWACTLLTHWLTSQFFVSHLTVMMMRLTLLTHLFLLFRGLCFSQRLYAFSHKVLSLFSEPIFRIIPLTLTDASLNNPGFFCHC